MNGAFVVHTGAGHTPETAIEGLLPPDTGWVFVKVEEWGETASFHYLVSPA